MDKIFRTRLIWLAVASLFLGLLPALCQLAANGYWLNATVGEGRIDQASGGLWSGIPLTLALCLGAELVFFGAFFYPVLKIGRSAVVAYLVANGVAAIYSSLIFVALAEPWSQAGWALLGLIVVPLVPLVLAIFLATVAIRRRSAERRSRTVTTIRL